MKKIVAIICLFVFAAADSFSQVTFQKVIGDFGSESGKCIQQTVDGGYIIAGSSTSSFGAGLMDVYLTKLDSYGALQWTKSYGAAGNDIAGTVQQTTDGGYIVTGWMASGSIANDFDIYMVKTNPTGDTLWTKTLGDVGWDHGNAGCQTTDGGYFICGYIDDRFSFQKTDANGNLLWEQIFGTGYDFAHSAQQTADGGFIMAGETGSFGAGWMDVFLVKADASGNILWAKAYGGAGYEYGWAVRQTSDGGYVIAGSTNSFGAGGNDVYLIRTNSSGDTLWTKTYGGTGDDNGYSVKQTADGGFIIAGETDNNATGNYDAYLIKTDVSGNALWVKTYGGINSDGCQSVIETSDGGYALAGSSSSFGSGNDIYVIKTNSTGSSGCNEANISTTVTSPSTVVSMAGIPVYVYASAQTNLATSVSNGGGVVTLCYSSPTEINETDIQKIDALFPNPASSQINFSFSKAGNYFLTVKNGFGETILFKSITEKQFAVDVKDFSAGVYFVTVRDENKNVMVKKFVKM